MTAPATYAEPAQPIAEAESPSVSGRCSAAPSEPTSVTSSPSSSQVTPSATTTRQCQADQGSASMRAGMVLRFAGVASMTLYSPTHGTQDSDALEGVRTTFADQRGGRRPAAGGRAGSLVPRPAVRGKRRQQPDPHPARGPPHR